MGVAASARRLLPALLAGLLAVSCGLGDGSDSAGAPTEDIDTAAQAPSPEPLPTGEQGPPRLQLVGELDEPVHLTSPPDDQRIFVVEKGGRIVEMVDGQARMPPFLDIRGEVSTGSEQGLLSMAFAPDFADSGLLYIYYTNSAGNSRLEELRVDDADPNRADPDSRRVILAVDQPFRNHNGGLVGFDADGMMMIGLGDGGSGGDPANRAQDLGVLLGKMLRIDPSAPSDGRPYGIPEDNPFVDTPGARPEIWAYGLRNPWRWAFDSETQDFYVADVGQNRVEEVNFAPPSAQPGANFGWRRYEGTEVYDADLSIDESRLVQPVLTYPNGSGACSVTGGGVYRGPVQALTGYYLYGDFCGGVVEGFRVEDGEPVGIRTFDMEVGSLSSFGVDSAGDVYVLSLAGGVYKIVAGEG